MSLSDVDGEDKLALLEMFEQLQIRQYDTTVTV